MTATIPTVEPSSWVRGETVKWTKALVDYLPASYVLSYAFVSTAGRIMVTASDNGDSTHLVEIPTPTSYRFSAGDWHWQSSVTGSGERYVIGSGVIKVVPDFASEGAGYDARSHVKRVLDAIEAVLEGRATEDHTYVQIEGKQVTHIAHADLVSLRSRYKAEYAREQKAARLAHSSDIDRSVVKVRM